MYAMPHSFGGFVASAIDLLVLLIIINVIVSWIVYFGKLSPHHPFVRGLNKIVDPLLAPVRRLIPPRLTGNLDVSPMIVILVLQFIANLLRPV